MTKWSLMFYAPTITCFDYTYISFTIQITDQTSARGMDGLQVLRFLTFTPKNNSGIWLWVGAMSRYISR